MGGVIALVIAALVGICGGIYLVIRGTGPGPVLIAGGVMMLALAGRQYGKAKKG